MIPVTLPNGRVIQAEVAVTPQDRARGLMFRKSLGPDQGMLFIHSHSGRHSCWMYGVQIPLDMVWMDDHHKIVELLLNAPPCHISPCPYYGGHEVSRYILEVPAGAANGLSVGQKVRF